MILSIRHRFSGKVLHALDLGDRRVPLYPADFSGCDLSNLDLNGAELPWANLERCNLRGTKLREANLYRANLRSAVVDYCCLDGADLRESDLRNVTAYPTSVNVKTQFYGAKISAGSEIEMLDIEVSKAIWRKMLR